MPTNKPTFDFSRPVTLSQGVSGAENGFTGQSQLGRASALVADGDAQIRLVAAELGDWANGAIFTMGPSLPGGRVSLAGRGAGGVQLVQCWPDVGETTEDAAQRLNAFNFDPHIQMSTDQRFAYEQSLREGKPTWRVRATSVGDGGEDPAPVGSATMAGGGGRSTSNGWEAETEDGNGGLFVFDAIEMLALRQVLCRFEESVAWAVHLCMISAGYSPEIVATIASGTGTSVLITDKSVYIPPSFGIAVAALSPGSALVTVQRA